MTEAELKLINNLVEAVAIIARDCYFQLGGEDSRRVLDMLNGIREKFDNINRGNNPDKGEPNV